MFGEFFNLDSGICEICPQNTYSIGYDVSNCNTCPIGGICNGGYNITLEPGYWRPKYFSDEIIECRN